MAVYSTSAIIIGRHNFGEADRVIVLLTPERGVIRAVAKGVRRIKSRLAGHLELFNESSLMMAEGKNMDVITSARLINHTSTSDDYDRMRLAYLVAEMINRLGSDQTHSEELYGLVKESFGAINEGKVGSTLELWFKLRLLDHLGYRPELSGCTICGVSDVSKEYYFNAELGGIVDLGCGSPGTDSMTHDQIKIWRLMLSNDFNSIQQVRQVEVLATASMALCNRFYDYTFGKRFRSAEVLG